ncbi:unnamed protein product [Dibothriocephalus latus]|uniref:PDZ domain-containing protein n=1 Tax=Dibothriocephalus latus TaxID=60516 RepID=A0A3P7LJU2_DIBLA|nr:unnamed protein product [Dibothriocephalus latus]
MLTNGKETAVSLANCSTSVGSLIGSLQDEVVSTNNVDLLLTSEPLTFPADALDAGPWQQTREIKLLKLPGESGWGLRLTGPELWDPSSSSLQSLPLPPGINRPCFVSEVISKSAADRCDLIEPGDIIVGVNGLDASSAGCRGVAEWIYSANLVTATAATVATSSSSSSAFSPSDGDALSSAPSPTNAVGLDNEAAILYLLTLPLSSLPTETLNRLAAPLLLNDLSPQPSEQKPDGKSILPVPLPSSVLSPTVKLDHHVSTLFSLVTALMEKYRRPSLTEDKILIVPLVIKPTSLSQPPNRSGHMDCETVGIRLVGHKDVNNRGVFICGIRESSLASAAGGLMVSDEIVQVQEACIMLLPFVRFSAFKFTRGLPSPLSLLISKEAESVRRLFSVGEANSRTNTLFIVVRRNPTYNFSVMAKPSNLVSHFPPGQTPVESEIKEVLTAPFSSFSPLLPMVVNAFWLPVSFRLLVLFHWRQHFIPQCQSDS